LDSKLIAETPGFKDLEAATKGDIWEVVLSGGEDHVFVATTSTDIPEGAHVIGKVVTGTEVKVSGVSKLPAIGFRHF
jgi:thiamine monophosphate kinase